MLSYLQAMYIIVIINLLSVVDIVTADQPPYYNSTACDTCTDVCSAVTPTNISDTTTPAPTICYQGDPTDENFAYNYDVDIPSNAVTACNTCIYNNYTFFVK